MAKFREHKGSLAEALETVFEVQTLQDVYEAQKDAYLGYPISELECEYYGHDSRLPEWNKTYMITAMLQGERIPLGFSNAELK